MSTRDKPDDAQLAIDIESELRKRIEAAAAERGVSLRDYLATIRRFPVDT